MGSALNGSTANAFFVAPVRSTANYPTGATGVLVYAATTHEITYNTTKTFVIDHPIDENKYLVHACLEGPEAGVYYRGKAEISNNDFVTIELPHYVSSLATNFTAHVTPLYSANSDDSKQLRVSDVENGSFNVHGSNGRFNWVVYGERAAINVEPLKSEVELKGTGPYKWI